MLEALRPVWPMLLAGGILIAVAIPMVLRVVPPNVWYGFRTQKTLRNPDIWYEANAYSGRTLVGAGAAIVAAALLLAARRVPEPDATMIFLVVLTLSTVVALGLSFHYLSTLE